MSEQEKSAKLNDEQLDSVSGGFFTPTDVQEAPLDDATSEGFVASQAFRFIPKPPKKKE